MLKHHAAVEFWKGYSSFVWIELTTVGTRKSLSSFSASRSSSPSISPHGKSLWKLNWFLRDFGYDTDLLGRDEVDEKALLGLTGVLRTTRKTFAGRTFVNLEGFAPSTEWEFISKDAREGIVAGGSDDLQLHAD
jgi:hypothetical protein